MSEESSPTIQVVQKPNARQEKVMDIIRQAPRGSRQVIGYGGDVGGGKTQVIAYIAFMLASVYPGAKILVCRALLDDLKRTTMARFFEVVPQDLYTFNKNDRIARFRMPDWPAHYPDAEIQFRAAKDFTRFQSEEYTAVLIDEADGVPIESIWWFISRLRQKPMGVLPKWTLMAASNPTHGWFYNWFVAEEKIIPWDKFRESGVGEIHFVPSRSSDNPHLDENYETSIRILLPEEMAKAMVGGDWEAAVNSVFDGMEKRTHILSQEALKTAGLPLRRVIIPTDDGGGLSGYIPKKFSRVIGGLDFAGVNKSAHHSGGCVVGYLPSGRDICLWDFHDRGPGVWKRQKAWMEASEDALGFKVQWVADKTQSTIIQELQLQKFLVEPSTGVHNGWQADVQRIRDRLELDGRGLPQSLFLNYAERTFDQMKRYRFDPKPLADGSSRDRPIKKNDDLVDPYRYQGEFAAMGRQLLENYSRPGMHPRPANQGDTPWAFFREMGVA